MGQEQLCCLFRRYGRGRIARPSPCGGLDAQSLALARHCAENGLAQEAHDILSAARALPPLADAEFKRLAPAEQAKVLIWRLRNQSGDVYQEHGGAVSIDLGADDSPANQLIALGLNAAPALAEAVNDRRFTRAVLFIRDTSLRRLVVARVGDFARVILETIAGKTFWDVPENEPSMWQEGVADRVQRRCRRWLESAKPAEEEK